MSRYNIDPDNVKKFQELVKKDDYSALNYWYKKVNPFIKGMERARKATLISLASGEDNYNRKRVHTLLVGPPGTGKSRIRNFCVNKLNANGAGPDTSEVGLKGDARGGIDRGLLALSHEGIVALEELDDFDRSELDALTQSMESGEYEITKGGEHETFQAEVRVVACCNSVKTLPRPVIDRFDFIIDTEIPSVDKAKDITNYIYENWWEDDTTDGDVLKDYLKWIRPYKPEKPTDEDMSKIMKIKNNYIEETEETDIREKESFLRVTETIARLNRRKIKVEDYIRAIKLVTGENLSKRDIS